MGGGLDAICVLHESHYLVCISCLVHEMPVPDDIKVKDWSALSLESRCQLYCCCSSSIAATQSPDLFLNTHLSQVWSGSNCDTGRRVETHGFISLNSQFHGLGKLSVRNQAKVQSPKGPNANPAGTLSQHTSEERRQSGTGAFHTAAL